LTVIVLHLRAQVPAGDSGCWHNRKASADALKAYLDATDPSERVMVLGDWNDDLDSSILAGYASPFDQFLADPGRYTFITRPLTDSHTGSTIWSSDCIDHQLVNQAMLPSFVTDSATVLRPDSFIANYSYTTSDHFPVRSTFLLGSADATPRLRLVAPSSASLEGYTSVTLRWASNRVESLEAAASLDNGANWTIIGSSIPASTGEYCWLVPNVATDSARIRLIDTARPSLSVTSPPLKVAARPGATSKVIINEVLPQPASGDSANEFVELVNTSPNYVDLGLWTLSDSTGTRHTFACGTRVDPGKALAVFGDPDAVPYGRGNAVAASTGGLHFDDAAGEVVLKVRPTLVGDTVSWTSSTAGVSLNRNPDGSAGAPLVPHSQVPGAVGDSSPGLRVDGNPF
jgi:hypothetical protein